MKQATDKTIESRKATSPLRMPPNSIVDFHPLNRAYCPQVGVRVHGGFGATLRFGDISANIPTRMAAVTNQEPSAD
jgi:hypothetical protein